MKSLIVTTFIFLTLSCAHNTTLKQEADSSIKNPEDIANENEGNVITESNLPVVNPEMSQAEEDNYVSRFGPVPQEFNAQVMKWITYFQGRGRKHMIVYLERSSRYLPLMKDILAQHGLPKDLVYISLIESGFKATAHSHASAVGYWQFIRGTGKRYGLDISMYIDERRDPILATHAAARYLKQLFEMFDDWYLAFAAYNAGERRVERAMRRARTKDFWDISRKRLLPRETRNYVPKYLAARMIAKNPKLYGFYEIDYKPAIAFDEIEIKDSISLDKLASLLNVKYEELFALNPIYRSDWVPVKNGKAIIRVPVGMKPNAEQVVSKSLSDRPTKAFATYFWYKIRSGDNLSRLARRYGTSVKKIRYMNNLSRRSLLRVGRKLRIPRQGFAVADNNPIRSKQLTSKIGTHRVRRGENLSIIARRYGVSVNTLKQINGLTASSVIKPGQRLKLKQEADRVINSISENSSIHVVKRGENLFKIAKKYNMSISELRQLNYLGRRSLIRAGQKLKVKVSAGFLQNNNQIKSSKLHVVKRGENLSLIARKNNVSLATLRKLNNLDRGAIIKRGQKLRLRSQSIDGRSSQFHVVSRGENLIEIAKKYNVAVSEIAKVNSIRNYSRINIGDKIIIP